MLNGKKAGITLVLMMVLILISSVNVWAADESIEKLKPVITFVSDAEYNGENQVLAIISGSEDGVELDPEKITISYQGREKNGVIYEKSEIAPVNAGTYTVEVVYDGDSNYESIQEKKTVKLNPMILKPDGFYTEEPVQKIYDGTVDLEVTEISKISHQNMIKDEINQDKIVFSFQSVRFFYKDVNPNSDLSEENAVILSGLSLSGEQAFNYTIGSLSDEDVEVLNEKIGEGKKICKSDVLIKADILAKPVGIFLTGKDKSYDGTPNLKEYGFSVNTEELVTGEAIAIETNPDFSPWYGEAAQKIKDVGEYQVFADGGFNIIGLNGTNGSNYIADREIICSHSRYEIRPVEIMVEPAYRYKYQGDEDPPLAYSVWQVTNEDQLIDGLFGDDVLYGNLIREAGEEPGKYDVYQGDLNNSNYIIYFQNGEEKFEIRAREEVVANLEGGDYYSNNGTTDKWEDKEVETAAAGGLLITLIIMILGIFFIRRNLTNMD